MMQSADERVKWFESKVVSSFRPRGDELTHFLKEADTLNNIVNFCGNEECRSLFVYQLTSGVIQCSLYPPEDVNSISRCMTFVKLTASTKLTRKNLSYSVSYFDNSVDTLANIDWLTRDLYLPTVTNEEDVRSHIVGGSRKKQTLLGDKYVDLMHRFLSSAEFSASLLQGEVALPYPSMEVLQEVRGQSRRNKSITHIIETTVVNWTKQLKVLLKIDPIAEVHAIARHCDSPSGEDSNPQVGASSQGGVGDMLPLVIHEDMLWRVRIMAMRKVEGQLHSETTLALMSHLDEQGNKYSQGLLEMRNDVTQAIEDAQDNLKFLSPLMKCMEELSETETRADLCNLFKPIIHTLFLIWQFSGHYHKKLFFHKLVSLVANQIMIQATTLLSANLLEDTKKAFSELKDALSVCGRFRGMYLDKKREADHLNDLRYAETKKEESRTPQSKYYVAKVYPPTDKYDLCHLSDNELWSDSPWPEKNSPTFDNFNQFMERCNDLLDFVETVHQFRLMRKVAEVGGAGSSGLDAQVAEIYEQFLKAMKSFTISHDDLLGLKRKSAIQKSVEMEKESFESQFFTFRLVIRDLEKRLAAVLCHSFQQCRTIGSQLRILEVFEGVNNREMIRIAIQKDDHFMTSSFLHELMSVKDMIEKCKNQVPEHVNVPVIVSKLRWQYALTHRIEVPMGKLLKVSPTSLQSEAGSQIQQLYREIMEKLGKYREKLLKDWQRGLNPEIKERLKDFVLMAPLSNDLENSEAEEADPRHDYNSGTLGPDLVSQPLMGALSAVEVSEPLRVNLDPSLLVLLREVHYLSQPPFEIRMPDSVKDIIRSMDFQTLRSLSARLEAIVAKYNYIMRSITSEEQKLFHRKLVIIEQLLEQGKSIFTWKMAETQDFIEHASQLVLNDLYYNLDKVKTNLKEIVDIFDLWSDGNLDIFHSRRTDKSYTMQELMDEEEQIIQEHDAYLRTSGLKVHALVNETFDCVEVSRGSPAWEEYLSNVDEFALKGLQMATYKSIRHLYNELADANNFNPKGEPLLVIKLALVDGGLGFMPPLDESSDERSVQETVEYWISQFLARGSHVAPISNNRGEDVEYEEYHMRIAQDPEISDYIEKIRTIVDSNCQDCKTLMVQFNDYFFLWTDDIPTVFQEFLRGKLQPYPLREEVRGHVSDQATAAKSSRSDKTASESSHSKSKLSRDRSSVPGFYATKKMTDRIFEHMPSLDAFETEIEIYKLARIRIDDMDDTAHMGWLKVDMTPIKEVIKGYSNKAIWTYTNYLIQQVSSVLTSLDQFLLRIEPELEQVTGNEDEFDDIMRIMHIFNEVSSQHAELDSKFTAMQRTVALVKKHGVSANGQELPTEVQKAFNSAPKRWSMLKNKVSLAKQRLSPTIHNQSTFITQKLESFGKELESLEASIAASIVYRRSCSIESAFEIIETFHEKLDELKLRAQDLYELQELLQIPAVDFKVLPRMRKELENLMSIWQMAQEVGAWQKKWLDTTWFNMNTDEVAASGSELESKLSEYPAECQHWDITESLIEAVNMIREVLPLVDDLSNSSMRARHWKQLYRETKSAIQIDQDTVRYMTLGKLLTTNLHVYAEDIRKAVLRAQSDLTIEQKLKTFEEIWLSKVFSLQEYIKSAMESSVDHLDIGQDHGALIHQTDRSVSRSRSGGTPGREKVMSIAAPPGDGISDDGGVGSRSRASSARGITPNRARRISLTSLPVAISNVASENQFDSRVFLLADCEEVFQKLELHQIELEEMRQNKDAGSFLDEIIKWQSILQNIESVVKVWLQTQQSWLTLDEIFSKSEISTVLPKEAILFSSLNKNFRTLMRATSQNRNILQCCSYKGILKTLEKMYDNFEFCHSSLLRNLEKRRSRFPRFYFLSDEDVISILASGNDLSRVSKFMYKAYEDIGQLVFDTVSGSAANEIAESMGGEGRVFFRITHVKSHMGEPLELNTPIICSGETEKWLNDIGMCLKTTLKDWTAVALEFIDLNYFQMDTEDLIGGLKQTRRLRASDNEGDTEGNPEETQPTVPVINVEKLNTAGLTRKTYIDLPNEVIYLALNCDLRSRAETCVNARSINELSSFMSSTQKALDKVSQIIISLDEVAANQNGLAIDEDESLDEIEALQNAFHGEPEIEATATLTELIQLEPENSDDPQPTMLGADQLPRRASSPYHEGIVAVGDNQNFLSPIANPIQSTSVENNDEASETQLGPENPEYSSDNVQETSEPNLESHKSESPAKDPSEPDNRASDGNLKDSEVNVAQTSRELESESANPVQTESFEANPVPEEINATSEEDVLKDTSEAVVEQGEGSFENEKVEGGFGDVSLNLEEGDDVRDDSPKSMVAGGKLGSELLPPRTSSVHKRSRKNVSSLTNYYHSAMMPYQKKKLEGVINLLITWRDSMQRGLDSSRRNVLFSFYWQQMLKFYSDPTSPQNPIAIKCFDETVASYQFEYQGSSLRQVTTPQTEKALVNMALSIAQFHPILCSGPAGGSKRETILELARTFGQALFKFGCSRHTNPVTIENVLKGVAASGLWLILHNVNSLTPGSLSLLGELTSALFDAVKYRKAELDLKPYFYPVKSFNNPGIFCTVNNMIPLTTSDPNYSVLRPSAALLLPPSVTSQFRQVSIMCPDLRSLYEASLISKGFSHSRLIAKKLCILRDCSHDVDEKIATRKDYFIVDKHWPGTCWSTSVTLRMLEVAGEHLAELKSSRKDQKMLEDKEDDSSDETLFLEVQALVKSLKNVFVAKYPGNLAASIFRERLLDIMPEAENGPITVSEQANIFSKKHASAIKKKTSGRKPDQIIHSTAVDEYKLDYVINPVEVEKIGLCASPAFLARIQQLADLCSTQSCVIVCGPAGCGKSSIIKSLARSVECSGNNVSLDRLVCGTLQTEELFGYFTPSNRWVDGGLNKLLRKYNGHDSTGSGKEQQSGEEERSSYNFLVLDGHVNANQMEIFGSVLHNNGKITFANNEFVILSKRIKILWEIESLAQLGPSVLSHTPVLAMNQSEVSYEMLLEVWLRKQWMHYQPVFQKFFDFYLSILVEYSRKMLKRSLEGGTDRVSNEIVIREVIDCVTIVDKVRTLLTLIDGLVGQFRNAGEQILERYFCFAAIWAFGGLFRKENRQLFSDWWHSQFPSSPLPARGTIWDYYIDPDSCDWARHDENLPSYSAPTQCGIADDAFVPTVSTQQLSNLVWLAQETGAPLMLVGESGCGKTSIVLDRLRNIWANDVSGVKAIKHSANSSTNAKSVWSVLNDNLEWKYASNFVPKGNKRLLCFIDDINLSQMDEYGNKSACELIRQHLDCEGVFDPTSMEWRTLSKTQYVTTINPNLSQKSLGPRFLRHFMIFNCPYPNNTEMHTIFKTLLVNHFLPHDLAPPAGTTMSSYKYNLEKTKVDKLLSTIVMVTTEVHNRLRTMFLPTVMRSHYVFTTRDISTIFTNVCLSLRPNCDRKSIILLWEHENQWVFGRRLVDLVDYDRYRKVFITSARKEFTNDEDFDALIEAETSPPTFSSLEETLSGVVIAGPQPGTVTRDGRYHDNYRAFEDIEEVKAVLKESIKEFNKSKPNIRIPLYKSTVEEICRVARILHSPHKVGHAQLVVDGSPGLSFLVVAMAAHLSNYSIFYISPSKLAGANPPRQGAAGSKKLDDEYKLDHFKAEISAAYKRAGVNNQKIVFLLRPNECNLDDEIMSHLQELIVSGPPVDSLFSQEEQTSIVNSIRSAVIQSGLPYSRQTAWNFFLKNVRENFRVVVASHISRHSFQKRCNDFPHLTTHMNIIYFHHWKLQQLIEVANYHVADENTSHVLANMHLTIREQDGGEKGSGQWSTLTNSTYEKFIERFVYLRNRREGEIVSLNDRMENTLHNIQQGEIVVARMKESLEHEKTVLQNQIEGTINLMGQIGQDKAIARQQLMALYKQRDKLISLKKALPEFRLGYERACYKTEKLYSETMKLVYNLDNTLLGELRSMAKPDQEIQDLLAIIIKILKPANSDSTWSKGAKRQMANLERFKEELLRFDQEPLKKVTMEIVEPLVNRPNFTPDQMTTRAGGNKSAGDLTQWVFNVIQYNKLKYEKVQPLKSKVERTGEELKEAESKMIYLESRREDLEGRLNELAKNFEKATIDKNNQQQATLTVDEQVELAEKFGLIMQGEIKVGQQIKQSFEERKETICGSVALSAAFAAYLGPYDFQFRSRMMLEVWPFCLTQRGIPVQFDSISPLYGRQIEFSFNEGMYSEDIEEEEAEEETLNQGEEEETEAETSAQGDFVVSQPHVHSVPEKLSVDGGQGSSKDTIEIKFNANESVQNMQLPTPTPNTQQGDPSPQGDEDQGQGQGQDDAGDDAVLLEDTIRTEEQSRQMEERAASGEANNNPSPHSGAAAPTVSHESVPENLERSQVAITQADQKSSGKMSPLEESVSVSGDGGFPHMVFDRYKQCIKSVVKLLLGEHKLNKWLAKGYSLTQIENAAILLTFGHVRPPLIIDPNNEAADWIASSFENIKYVSIDSKDPNRRNVILEALKEGKEEEDDDDDDSPQSMPSEEATKSAGAQDNQTGRQESTENEDEKEEKSAPATIVVSGVTEMPDSLLNTLIFNKNMQREEAKWEEPGLLFFDGRMMVCNEDYSLILTSNDPHIKFDPSIVSLTTLVSYKSSDVTLSQTLLDITFEYMHPRVFLERRRVLRGLCRCHKAMSDFNSRLLDKMTNFSGDHVWEDAELATKIVETHKEIGQKIEAYNLVLDRQNSLRSKLLPIADRAADIFFLVQNLHCLNPNYSFPVNFLINIFKEVLSRHCPHAEQETQLGDQVASTPDPEINAFEHFISTRGTRAVESDDEDEEGGEGEEDNSDEESDDEEGADEDFSLDNNDHTNQSAVANENAEGEEDEIKFVDTEQVLRLSSADYTSQPSNKVKKIANELVQNIFTTVSKSLSPEHRLLFAAFLTLKLRWAEISREELLFLIHGSPNHQETISLESFGTPLANPDWIPKDRFHDVMALSLLPTVPLSCLCREIVENEVEWKSWLNEENCEMVPLPRDEDYSWKDIHKLIVIRILRPDRFSPALKRFVEENLSFALHPDEPSAASLFRNPNTNDVMGFLVPVSAVSGTESAGDFSKIQPEADMKSICTAIEDLAEKVGVHKVRVLDPATDSSLAVISEALEKSLKSSDTQWMVLKNSNFLETKTLHRIFQLLVHIALSPDLNPGNKLWVVGELPNGFQIPVAVKLFPISGETLLQNMGIGGDLLDIVSNASETTSEPSKKPEYFARAIKHSVLQVPAKCWAQVEKNITLRNSVLAICIINAVILAKQTLSTHGLGRVYSLLGNELCQAVEHLLKNEEPSNGDGLDDDMQRRSGDGKSTLQNEDFVEFLINHVYGRMMLNARDLKFVEALLKKTLLGREIRDEVHCLRKYQVPLPPANLTSLQQVADWFTDKCEWRHASSAEYLDIPEDCIRSLSNTKNEPFFTWMSTLGSVYLPLVDPMSQSDLEHSVNQVRMSIDLCYDHLPPLLNVEEDKTSLFLEPIVFSFPYHPPSRFSSTISSISSPNESMSHVLQQECLFLNEWLCYIRQSLHDIEVRLLRGMSALPAHLHKTALSLSKEQVPLDWCPSTNRPSTHTLYSFLKEMVSRHEQMSDWLKRGVVPSKRNPNGRTGSLKEVWLGGLVNPMGLLDVLLSQTAVQHNTLMDQVSIVVEASSELKASKFPPRQSDGKEVIVRDLYLQGAEWDVTNKQLRPVCPSNPVKMPPLKLTPMTGQQLQNRIANTRFFKCPLYTNKSLSSFVTTLDLACHNDELVFDLMGTCLLLDAGPSVCNDLNLASTRMRLAHIKKIPKDLPDETYSDIIATSRTKLSKGESLQSLINNYEKAAMDAQGSARSKKSNRSVRLESAKRSTVSSPKVPADSQKPEVSSESGKVVEKDTLSPTVAAEEESERTTGNQTSTLLTAESGDEQTQEPEDKLKPVEEVLPSDLEFTEDSEVAGGPSTLRDERPIGESEDELRFSRDPKSRQKAVSNIDAFPIMSPDTLEPSSPHKSPTRSIATPTSQRSQPVHQPESPARRSPVASRQLPPRSSNRASRTGSKAGSQGAANDPSPRGGGGRASRGSAGSRVVSQSEGKQMKENFLEELIKAEMESTVSVGDRTTPGRRATSTRPRDQREDLQADQDVQRDNASSPGNEIEFSDRDPLTDERTGSHNDQERRNSGTRGSQRNTPSGKLLEQIINDGS